MVQETAWMEVVDAVDDDELDRIREEVARDAATRQSKDVEGTALRMLDRHKKLEALLKLEKADLLAQMERLQRENANLKGRLSISPEAGVQAAIDRSILSLRVGRHETEQAITVVNHIRQLHSLPVDPRARQGAFEVQLVEAKRSLNRALRSLLFESHAHASQVPLEVIKYVDKCELDADAEPNLQMVFIEGEALIFRMSDLRLQPKDIFSMCSLDEQCPKEGSGLGFKSVFVVADGVVLISPPFQVRLDGASRGPAGILCPEWVASLDAQTPDGEDIIPASYHSRIRENSTFVYAPLRESAKPLLKAVDVEVPDGLCLAFLRSLRRVDCVYVSYEGPDEVKVIKNASHEVVLTDVELCPEAALGAAVAQALTSLKAACRVSSHVAYDVELTHTQAIKVPDRQYDEKLPPTVRHYRMHSFTLTTAAANSDKGTDKQSTTLSFAFPLGPDRRPPPLEMGPSSSPASRHTEPLYCPVAVPQSGRLPFALRADFDLTNGRLCLHPTSAWNAWALACAARLFVAACLADDLIRDSVESYLPDRAHCPSGPLWHDCLSTLEGLVHAHMYTRSEGGAMVPRHRALRRPPTLPASLLSDALLARVTNGAKRLAESPENGQAPHTSSKVDGPRTGTVPLELVLRCVQALAEEQDGQLSDEQLRHLWAHLAAELSRGESALTPAVRVSLTETLRIYPTLGGTKLRRLSEDGQMLYRALDAGLAQALAGSSQLASVLVPTLDLACLCPSDPADPKLSSALSLLRLTATAEVKDLRVALSRALSRASPIVTDPSSFWALHTLATQRLGFRSLADFLGAGVSMGVPVLEPPRREGDEPSPHFHRLDGPRARLLLPTFLGVPLGPCALLLRCVPPAPEPALLLHPPPESQASWKARVEWERHVATEVGVDGGSHRKWQAVFAALKPSLFVKAALEGLGAQDVGEEEREAFGPMLQTYVGMYGEAFVRCRKGLRASSGDELWSLAHGPDYWTRDDKAGALRCTSGFLHSCASLSRSSPTATPLLSAEALAAALHVHPHALGPEGEALCGHTGAALSSLECGYDVLAALLLVTRHALRPRSEGGAEALQGSNAEDEIRPVSPPCVGWGHVLCSLFQLCLSVCVPASPSDDADASLARSLLSRYVREVGLWVASSALVGTVACIRPSAAVWTLEDDPISAHVAASEPSRVVVLGTQWGQGWDEGRRARLESVLSSWADLNGAAIRRRVGGLLDGALQQWAQHKGPMPRVVQDLYRAVGSATELAASAPPLPPPSPTVERPSTPAPLIRIATPVRPPTPSDRSAARSQAHNARHATALLGVPDLPLLRLDFTPTTASFLAPSHKPSPHATVAVTAQGDVMDTTVSWFYRHFFPSRCLHPAITTLLTSACPALLARVDLARPLATFTDAFADPATGSVVGAMRSMNVEGPKVAKMVGDLYACPSVPLTDLPRLWANVEGLRDAVLAEFWKEGQSDAGPRDDELLDTVANQIRLPVMGTREGASPSSLPLLRCHVPDPPLPPAPSDDAPPPPPPPPPDPSTVYLGSILGIDLELDRLDPPLRVVKHPCASRDSNWHKQARPEDGFATVEQSCYWERFLLVMGVRPPDEAIIAKLANEVLNKVFLALVKFNALLNGPTKDSVASKYSIWHSYHHLYQALPGNAYLSQHQERRGKTVAKPPDAALQASLQLPPPPVARGHSSSGPPFSVVGSFDYGPPSPFPPQPGYGVPPFGPGGFGGPPPPHHGHPPPVYFPPDVPPLAEAYPGGGNSGNLVPSKRPLDAGEDGGAPKVIRLQPPNVRRPLEKEEGEIEEGEIC